MQATLGTGATQGTTIGPRMYVPTSFLQLRHGGHRTGSQLLMGTNPLATPCSALGAPSQFSSATGQGWRCYGGSLRPPAEGWLARSPPTASHQQTLSSCSTFRLQMRHPLSSHRRSRFLIIATSPLTCLNKVSPRHRKQPTATFSDLFCFCLNVRHLNFLACQSTSFHLLPSFMLILLHIPVISFIFALSYPTIYRVRSWHLLLVRACGRIIYQSISSSCV